MSDSTRHLSLRLIREFLLPYRMRFFIGVVCMIFVAAMTAGQAYLLQPVVDDVFMKRDPTMLTVLPLLVIVVAVTKGMAAYGQWFIMNATGQRIICDMQMRLYAHLVRTDIAFFTRNASGALISRFTNDIYAMRNTVTRVFTGVARDVVTLFFLVGVMFYHSWILSLVVFVVFPIGIYPIVRLGKRMRKVARGIQHQLADYTNRLDESFQGIRVIKAYQREEYEIQRNRENIENIYGLYHKAAKISALSSPVMEMLGGIAIAVVIFYAGKQEFSSEGGGVSVGALTSFIAAFLLAYRPMKSLSTLNTVLQEGLASAQRLFTMLDMQPAVVDIKGAKRIKLKPGQTDISFNDVGFSYQDGTSALNGLSFSMKAGEKIALVGPSGGGKSTILNLLLRFYDPQYGQVIFGGHDIKEMTIDSLRKHISIVSQEVVLFDDTVAANIAFGDRKASQKAIEKAAKAAAAHEFITALPEGYKTKVGPNGITLSGGQRQRLAIARAFLTDAPVLLLDEATSALDPVSEKHIQTGLEHLMEGRTTIMIAHRLSTVKNADTLFVVKAGEIVESGTHEGLLRKKGEYSRLYQELL